MKTLLRTGKSLTNWAMENNDIEIAEKWLSDNQITESENIYYPVRHNFDGHNWHETTALNDTNIGIAITEEDIHSEITELLKEFYLKSEKQLNMANYFLGVNLDNMEFKLVDENMVDEIVNQYIGLTSVLTPDDFNWPEVHEQNVTGIGDTAGYWAWEIIAEATMNMLSDYRG